MFWIIKCGGASFMCRGLKQKGERSKWFDVGTSCNLLWFLFLQIHLQLGHVDFLLDFPLQTFPKNKEHEKSFHPELHGSCTASGVPAYTGLWIVESLVLYKKKKKREKSGTSKAARWCGIKATAVSTGIMNLIRLCPLRGVLESHTRIRLLIPAKPPWMKRRLNA